MSEFVVALVGAVVGGLMTMIATWWSTKRVLEHEAQQARTAAEEERQAARHALSRMAVLELMRVLAELEAKIDTIKPSQRYRETLDLVASIKASHAPLLPEAIQKRWDRLNTLVVYLSSATPTKKPDRSDWTEPKINRARDDVGAYLRYVRRSLLALINEQDLPPDASMPVLQRVDMAVWPAPDEGGPIGQP
jgi:hypothetical protein